MPLLPQGYKKPEGNYYKLKEGENLFRIVSEAITGFEYWTADRKVFRSPEEFTETPGIKTDKNGKAELPKHFWAFLVWNYNANKVQILEITQVGIQDALSTLENNPKWGSTLEYDISIAREGSGLDTTYQVTPNPKEALDEGVKAKIAQTKVNLNALYEGAEPFDGVVPTDDTDYSKDVPF